MGGAFGDAYFVRNHNPCIYLQVDPFVETDLTQIRIMSLKANIEKIAFEIIILGDD